MKIVMLGAGALGSTIGGTLAIGGNDVHFVDMWQEHVDLINKDGLHMTIRYQHTRMPGKMRMFVKEETVQFFDLM